MVRSPGGRVRPWWNLAMKRKGDQAASIKICLTVFEPTVAEASQGGSEANL